jgi:hypothetical protein
MCPGDFLPLLPALEPVVGLCFLATIPYLFSKTPVVLLRFVDRGRFTALSQTGNITTNARSDASGKLLGH